MNITNELSALYQYAIISYSHADSEIVESELKEFDNHSVCYWYDKQMTGGMGYDKQFSKMLDNKNCKGIVFFVSDSFLLSGPCAEEMRELKTKYGVENPDKFCLFIHPKDFSYKDENKILEHVNQYVEAKNDAKAQERLKNIKEHIALFLELSRNGKVNYAKIDTDNYIDNYCKEDGLFYMAGITFGRMQVNDVQFGYFPQQEDEGSGVKYLAEERNFDKNVAYYAPVKWLVIKDNEQTQTLLSEDLLFAVDYLGLKHPFKETNKTLEEQIKYNFTKYFKQADNDKRKIKNIRFLSEKELEFLLFHSQKDLEKKRKILLPKPTFFAETSDVKNVPAFWLAGDINNARWVDAATENLSEQKVGTELYYVRIVVDIEKPHIEEK